MKKILLFILALLMFAQVVACGSVAPPIREDVGPFPGKIALVTSAPDQTLEENYTAKLLVSKYGDDKILHYVWPENFMDNHAEMVNIMAEIATDSEVKVVIINQAVFGTNRAVDKLLETRKDVFIIYCEPAENFSDVVLRADIAVSPNHYSEGLDIIDQAMELGAKTFVHYSFPRHMAMVSLAERRDIMQEVCEGLGIEFVDAHSPDPTSNVGLEGAQQFILEDVPKMIEIYGEDTAFFSTNCGMQTPLIKAVTEHHGIFPRPCCPSPLHGFAEAFDIGSEDLFDDISYVVEETRRIVAEAGMTGRLSTWAVPTGIMLTTACTEYAIKWINGEAPESGVDMELFTTLCEDYARQTVDMDVQIHFTNLEERGVDHDRVLMLSMGYLVY